MNQANFNDILISDIILENSLRIYFDRKS